MKTKGNPEEILQKENVVVRGDNYFAESRDDEVVDNHMTVNTACT